MQHEVRQGQIAFLLSLAAMSPACDFDTAGDAPCVAPEDHGDDDEGDDEGDDAVAETGGGEAGGTTGVADEGGETAGGEATGGATGDPGGEAESTTGTVEPPICQPYVDHYLECFPSGDAQVLLEGCIYSVNAGHAFSPDCGTAVEDWYACLVATPCDVVLAGEPFCEGERAALDGACPSMDDTTGG